MCLVLAVQLLRLSSTPGLGTPRVKVEGWSGVTQLFTCVSFGGPRWGTGRPGEGGERHPTTTGSWSVGT